MSHQSRPLLAAVYMTGAMLSFTLMAVAGRELGGLHDTFEIMMYRSILGIVIVVAIAAVAGTLHEIRTDRLGLHATRNLFHFTGQNLWFFAVTLIPMAQLFALEFTTPLWVALLAPIFIGEKWAFSRVFAAVLGFTGILIVTRPGAMDIGPGVLAAIGSAVFFASQVLATKVLSRTQTVTCILFWLVVMQAVMGVITAGADGHIALPSWQSAPLLATVGCCGLFSHWCITNALSIAPATIVSPMEFLRLPLVAFVAYLLYSEPLDSAIFLGAAVVFGANLLNIFAEQRRQNVPV